MARTSWLCLYAIPSSLEIHAVRASFRVLLHLEVVRAQAEVPKNGVA